MSRFRKFCDIVFVLALLLSVGALACAWYSVEPIASFVQDNASQPWFNICLWVCLGIDLVGMLIILFHTAFSRTKSSYQKISNDNGAITISRAAVRHVVDQVVYDHPEFRSIKTFVYISNVRKPYLSIVARVAPRGLVAADDVSERMQNEIKEAVEEFTGTTVHDVTIDIRENRDLSDVMDQEEDERPSESSDLAVSDADASDDDVSDSEEADEDSDDVDADFGSDAGSHADSDGATSNAMTPNGDADESIQTSASLPDEHEAPDERAGGEPASVVHDDESKTSSASDGDSKAQASSKDEEEA